MDRECTVGAICEGLPGHQRSERVPGVVGETCGPTLSVARQRTAEACALLVSALARSAGARRAAQVVLLGDGARGIGMQAEEPCPRVVQRVDASHARAQIWDVARAAMDTRPLRPPERGTVTCLVDTEAESVHRTIQQMRSPVVRALAHPRGLWHGGRHVHTRGQDMREDSGQAVDASGSDCCPEHEV